MNNQKLISILQSRIARRKRVLKECWMICRIEKTCTEIGSDFSLFKQDTIELGVTQKQDKMIMKALIEAERKYEYHANTCHRLTQEVLKLRRQLASYKLTGKPYISGNAN